MSASSEDGGRQLVRKAVAIPEGREDFQSFLTVSKLHRGFQFLTLLDRGCAECQIPAWMAGRRCALGSALRKTSRVTGATSPSPLRT